MEKDRDRNINRLPLIGAPGESNWRPFRLWDDAQLTEPHQSGGKKFFKAFCFPSHDERINRNSHVK